MVIIYDDDRGRYIVMDRLMMMMKILDFIGFVI
jgi:hypothetical protein